MNVDANYDKWLKRAVEHAAGALTELTDGHLRAELERITPDDLELLRERWQESKNTYQHQMAERHIYYILKRVLTTHEE